MITPASSESSDPDHGFQIAPMVDVVFVLLLFFMALAGMQQIEKHLKADLPAGPGPGIPLVIDISAAGEVRCNGLELLGATERDPARLAAWLKNVADSEPNAPVAIRPTPDAEHGRFIQVLATLQQAGLSKISFL